MSDNNTRLEARIAFACTQETKDKFIQLCQRLGTDPSTYLRSLINSVNNGQVCLQVGVLLTQEQIEEYLMVAALAGSGDNPG